jgi:hypothetical protein
MREDDRDRVSRLGTEAWKRLKKTKDYNDWLKVGEALTVGREWAMNQAQTNKPEGKAYNMAFGEWMMQYKLNDMDKGDRSRLFQVMEALPMIEEWRRTLTLTERLKLNHPNAVLRKWKAAWEVPDKTKPAKPGLRDSVAKLSEEVLHLKNERVRLEAYVEELTEASTGSGSDTALLWVAHSKAPGVHRVQAPTAGGVYDIVPNFKTVKRKHIFAGYSVRYVTLQRNDPKFDGDPDAAENEDIRLIKTDVLSETEGKAIAQEDFQPA